jgi:hypothetical protein
MLADAPNSNLNLQRYKILFISGNYSRIFARRDRRITSLEVRHAFTPSYSMQHRWTLIYG